MNMEKLSALLIWALENLGPLDELKTTETGALIRLKDGRAGMLIMGPDGVPMASIPSEVMTT